MSSSAAKSRSASCGVSVRGFTLIELLVVLFIMSLMTAISVPLFSKFTETSRVQQAAVAVDSALFQARSQAQNLRIHVAVFYGDDLKSLGLALMPNPLPSRGNIEVWGVLGTSGQTFAGYNQTSPWNLPGGSNGWFPFLYQTKMLLRSPITVASNIRVISGYFQRYAVGAGKYNCDFSFPAYRRDGQGEIKRHQTVYSQIGGTVRNDNNYAYNYVLIFDEGSGDHLVMEVGRSQTATRPRILPYRLTHIGGTQINDLRDMKKMIDNYPGNQ
jgi:prepilin-type N-terminal cleavage/methylation domain-containing protein